ncbi:amino acid adenylation domain-containing protein [Streptomyces camelliae]|uniref:Amino acid adenylation domain-containing protein n=1 Tax=Streptomyces camelliae TaxID=3004093 RepID=A0ABY7P609_9ACTN|nr:amino acid adenylation domain-containing protein [Streptomyces sp. HUAS 2-6]WBO65117.1 amino acid adenylation domain-containing protein [Streptomyces sp. HUAS 2-6]
MFEYRTDLHPDRCAVAAEDAELTYGELDGEANALAADLIARGVEPGESVLCSFGRSAAALVAHLAVLKAGAVYVPVDPQTPPNRLRLLAERTSAVAVLSTPEGLRSPDPVTALRLPVAVSRRSGVRPPRRPRPADVAYIIFTSGSTGEPKGVVVSHRAITSTTLARLRHYEDPVRRFLMLWPMSFDASLGTIWWTLASGGTLELAPESLDGVMRAVDAVLSGRTRISHTSMTPSHYLTALRRLPEPSTGPDVMLVAGEQCPAPLVSEHYRLQPGTRLYNSYGPTEAAVWCAGTELLAGADVTVGRAIPGAEILVLDDEGNDVPAGEPGEVSIRGTGLAEGYLGDPELTARRFFRHPAGVRYRTGDLGRLLPDGRLVILGRKDDQVKIRGRRIEPGEIEGVLHTHPGVAQAVVLAHQDRLVAYVVCSADRDDWSRELREFAGRWLPDYMTPNAVVVLDALPMKPNGKVDKEALPVPAFQAAAKGRAPRSPEEKALCGLVAEVLEVPDAALGNDFFDLGGNSLLAMRLVARVRTLLNRELTVRSVFDHPVLEDLVAQLGERRVVRRDLVPAARPDRVPLSFAQRRMWFLNQLEGPSATYNIPFPLRLRGPLDRTALWAAIGDVVSRHESLRTVFPESGGEPYQRVLAAAEAGVEADVVECTHSDVPKLQAEFENRGFDVSSEPPLRARLLRLGPDEHVLLLVLHHIACDGWSMAPLARDLARAYTARTQGPATSPAPLPVQYADFSLWQRETLGGTDEPESVYTRQLDFWTTALAGIPDQLDLPCDYARPAHASFRGEVIDFRLEAEIHRRMTEFAATAGVSVFMVFQAALAALLTRLGSGTDIPIGSPVAGRFDESLDDLVGFFVNTLVLRTDTSGDPTFKELVARVREFDLSAFANEDLPFENLVEALNPPRSLARHPLCQVVLAFQNNAVADMRMPGLDVTALDWRLDVARFDLLVTVTEPPVSDGAQYGLDCGIEYATDLFDRRTVESLAECLVRMIERAMAEPGLPIGDIDIGHFERAGSGSGLRDAVGEAAGSALAAPDGQADRSAKEEALRELFADVLGIDEVGVTDDFFDLGGHSLLATRLVLRVRSEMGYELTVRELFDFPSVESLTGRLTRKTKNRPALGKSKGSGARDVR